MEEQAARWLLNTSRLNQAKILEFILSKRGKDSPISHIIGEVENFEVLKQGWFNIVLKAHRKKGAWIIRVRFSDSSDLTDTPFHKEAYLLELIQDTIPAPRLPKNPLGSFWIEELGKHAHFFIQLHIEGSHPDKLWRGDVRRELFESLGEHAKKIHSFRLSGYGNIFLAGKNQFSCNQWKDVIAQHLNELSSLTKSHEFKEQRELIGHSLKLLKTAGEWKGEPTLYHHDFAYNWANVLIDQNNTITGIIDWETAGAGPSLALEASSLLYCSIRDGLSARQILEDFDSFLTGYGESFSTCIEKHINEIHGLLALEGLRALHKYLTRKANGTLFREPWRRTFAKRALCMLESLNDGHFDDLRSWAA